MDTECMDFGKVDVPKTITHTSIQSMHIDESDVISCLHLLHILMYAMSLNDSQTFLSYQ